MSAVWHLIRLPVALYLLTAIAILSCVLRLVVISTVPAAELAADPIQIRYMTQVLLSWAHIAPGLLFLLIGPLQLIGAIRRRAPGVHRWLGRVFVIAGLISGIAVFPLALRLPAMGGWPTILGTWAFSAWMLYALVTAWRAIRARQVPRHRAFMIRAYAVGSAVATTRLIGGALEGLAGIPFLEGFWIAIWSAMLLHVAVAEVILARTRPTPRRT